MKTKDTPANITIEDRFELIDTSLKNVVKQMEKKHYKIAKLFLAGAIDGLAKLRESPPAAGVLHSGANL